MFYEAKNFLETADKETLHIISNARKLTREYYFNVKLFAVLQRKEEKHNEISTYCF